MQTNTMKKALSLLCALALVMCSSVTAFAAGVNESAFEGSENLKQVATDIQNNFVAGASENANAVINSYDTVEDDHLQLNMKARDTWRIADDIFNGQESVTASDPVDMYIVQTTTDRASAMKIVSSNTNLIVRLYILDMNTGDATGTNIYDSASDSSPQVLATLPAGNYVLGVYSTDSSVPAGSYTLMWNCSNPAGASTIVNYDNNLTKVILGYSDRTAIYCNGVNWLDGLEWEEHYTFTSGNSYTGRDQSISSITVRSVNVGSFTSNKYSTNNALFVSVGVGTLWTIMRSQYTNNYGDVTHVMNYFDATGRETPRRFDSLDMENGPHYIVIDMDTNQVVDFASPYNYLWLSGQITGSASFTATNILNQ